MSLLRDGLRRRLVLALAVALAPARRALGQSPWGPAVGVDSRMHTTPEGVIARLLQGAPMRRGKVKLELPPRAESGHSVPLTISVDSPMTEADHVRRIDLVSAKNPVTHMATFFLGPDAGRAEVGSRVRLNGTQRVTAIAQLADGSFWFDTADVIVQEPACMDGT